MQVPERAEIYARQLCLPEVGQAGQARLGRSSVLVIGAGGLGSPLLFNLAGAGIGRIGVIDADTVSASDLNRQHLYTPADIGLQKAEQAKKRLQSFHPDLEFEAYTATLDLRLALELFPAFDLIVGAVDNNPTRRLINAACCQLGKTWIDGGVSGFSGYAVRIVPGLTPCFDCYFGFAGLPLPTALPEADKTADANHSQQADACNYGANTGGNTSGVKTGDNTVGIIGATAGVTGSIEAALAIFSLLELQTPLKDEIIYYFSKDMTMNRVKVAREQSCPVCAHLFE
ncbi:MAG: HesA/MoeB/ThiF family protein [Ruminococcaceae bacterium]|nr:HesA/MoeB/ThiF family protein [Oscillospiraceae bacterium]